MAENLKKISFSEHDEAHALRRPKWAAAYIGRTENFLAKLRVKGGGPRYFKQGQLIYYRRADLDAWISEYMLTSTSDGSRRAAAA